MNVLFLSPAFPPQHALYCAALRARGIAVLGVGDTPPHELSSALRDALAEYVYVPDLHAYDALLRAAGYLTWRHGRIDRVDSLNEYWLGLEARLREDFNVPGLRPAAVARQRSKAGMAELFRAAGVPHPAVEPVTSAAQARAFAARHGYPLVLKPDVGVGAAETHKVASEAELDAALARPLAGYVVQRFVEGALTSFDGLVDRDGRVVFASSFVYSSGVMEIVQGGLDVYYYTRRVIPAALEELGRRALAAFELRERFFHLEFFEHPDGGFTALEANLRPPGGFSVDLMNYACDVDVYRWWAAVVAGDARAADAGYERRYHAAHVARRRGRRYRVPHDALVRELGPALMFHRAMPPAFAVAMGDEVYLVRHAELAELLRLIALVHARAEQ